MVLGHGFDHLVHVHVEIDWLVIVVVKDLVVHEVLHSVMVVLSLSLFNIDGLCLSNNDPEGSQNVKILFHFILNNNN